MAVDASASGFQRSGAFTLDWMVQYDNTAKTIKCAFTSRPDKNVRVCDMVVTLVNSTTRTYNIVNLDAATAAAFGFQAGKSLMNLGERTATGVDLKLGADKRATKIPSVSVRFKP